MSLLHRMINLEELKLFLLVARINPPYIDGLEIDDILDYMPKLKKFTFSINTGVCEKYNKIHLLSNEEIQDSFNGRRCGEVGSDVFYHSMQDIGLCHVYSLPYQFEHFFRSQ